MFRASLARSSQLMARSATQLPRLVSPHIRFQSTHTPGGSQVSDGQAKDRTYQKLFEQDWNAPVITYEQLKPKTESPSPDAFLIDVREPDEVIQGMIPSAVNLPLSVLAESFQSTSEVFEAKHGFPKPDYGQELTFYCRSGKRSSTASDIAYRQGYKSILNYKGSWLEWIEKEGNK
ncbi:endoplasmic reticulum protein [Moniliophthora roreri MCA 2997]|uniref:Endoplasmic reticulum protein n=1 Tax=Moniliophthora roreri (strain MCA 2997) TaxID=1381753 RepID=V2XXE3_MONRO|nr:endoplasmic reticulum protein [Moniliophthora roreri MCA 2997]KAI3622558.1 endoplasmic reticulum protein [Moniliophthora roreri]